MEGVKDHAPRILAAAREVLALDPRAPMSAVAASAGLGMSTVYRFFPSKQALVEAVVDAVEDAFIGELERANSAIDGGEDVVAAYRTFVLSLIAAGVGALPPRAAGMADAGATGRRWAKVSADNRRLFDRAQQAGAFRQGVTFHDIGLLLAAAGAVRGADLDRSGAMQQRLGGIMLDGLGAGHPPLEGGGAQRRDVYGTP